MYLVRACCIDSGNLEQRHSCPPLSGLCSLANRLVQELCSRHATASTTARCQVFSRVAQYSDRAMGRSNLDSLMGRTESALHRLQTDTGRSNAAVT